MVTAKSAAETPQTGVFANPYVKYYHRLCSCQISLQPTQPVCEKQKQNTYQGTYYYWYY